MNYYKRATAYLSLGRSTSALDDFERILQLNPSFSQAHYQKAKILAKEGDFHEADKELKAFGKLKIDPEAEELVSSSRRVSNVLSLISTGEISWSSMVGERIRRISSF